MLSFSGLFGSRLLLSDRIGNNGSFEDDDGSTLFGSSSGSLNRTFCGVSDLGLELTLTGDRDLDRSCSSMLSSSRIGNSGTEPSGACVIGGGITTLGVACGGDLGVATLGDFGSCLTGVRADGMPDEGTGSPGVDPGGG